MILDEHRSKCWKRCAKLSRYKLIETFAILFYYIGSLFHDYILIEKLLLA